MSLSEDETRRCGKNAWWRCSTCRNAVCESHVREHIGRCGTTSFVPIPIEKCEELIP
jgi:hypothetical protein